MYILSFKKIFLRNILSLQRWVIIVIDHVSKYIDKILDLLVASYKPNNDFIFDI